MRRPIIAGNWKLNKTIVEAVDLANKLKAATLKLDDRTAVVCPPFTALSAVADALRDSDIAVGGQDIFWEDSGAFTGEISGPMLKSAGCTYVIIGHSERRQLFGETNDTVNKKLLAALKNCLFPIVCVGETLEERKTNQTFEVIKSQVNNSLANLTNEQLALTVIAYEPVWAIGTGLTATPAQAEEVHAFIRTLLCKEVAEGMRILYGGSVKPDNVKELMGQKDIDGALVGGASLKAPDFISLINY
ncbi:triose-phosphate isomerase [Candidatus Saganbacteria bacterium]|nr:triose-phosphate isomerase [Candidatus Saganbacteria bacterium]